MVVSERYLSPRESEIGIFGKLLICCLSQKRKENPVYRQTGRFPACTKSSVNELRISGTELDGLVSATAYGSLAVGVLDGESREGTVEGGEGEGDLWWGFWAGERGRE